MPNRLARETSPYLLQHRDNPVDWYPWGAEAMERARAEDRPLLLSVGYSACHWCHVMAHESFEDAETARLMNELFINVKVDREERPDVDSVYMTAVQRMTGHGGWPMTVFLTPEGVPFYGGTYYPPEPRHGLPSFRQILEGVADAYRTRRAEVERSGAELRDALQESMAVRAPQGSLDLSILNRAFHALAARFDARRGGFGGAPKFPQAMVLEFLLRQWARTGSQEALAMVETTLRQMAGGGIYDQLGGGFHRYSVDADWLVPHFEKMLYDNALLARVYLHGYQATGEAEHRRVVEEILLYVEREMRSPEGAFYSAQDADSEGEEGVFYLWSSEEVDSLLGPEDGPLFRAFYDVTPGGNFEGRSILHLARSSAEVAVSAGVSVEAVERALGRGREILYAARAERVWPGRDEKVLTAWNAMMIHAFAEAARVLAREEYAEVATAAADFLLRELRPAKRLLRSWKDGPGMIAAFLEDHALLVDALLALYEATGEARWVAAAREIADDLLDLFWEEEEGVFYDTARDAEPLVVRPRDPYDNATPAGGSAASLALLRLAAFTGEARYARAAARALAGMGELMTRIPSAFGHLLSALDFHLATPREVVVVGQPGAEGTEALLAVTRRGFSPNTVVAPRDPAAGDEVEALVPLLEGRVQVDGRATAYVCERFACRAPVTEPGALAELLGDRGAG